MRTRMCGRSSRTAALAITFGICAISLIQIDTLALSSGGFVHQQEDPVFLSIGEFVYESCEDCHVCSFGTREPEREDHYRSIKAG